MRPPRTAFYPLERQTRTSSDRKGGILPLLGAVMPCELAETAPEGREGIMAESNGLIIRWSIASY